MVMKWQVRAATWRLEKWGSDAAKSEVRPEQGLKGQQFFLQSKNKLGTSYPLPYFEADPTLSTSYNIAYHS
jgi:hypothetical protein